MDLQGCVNDANDWAAALAERGFKVAKLLDDQATKAAMVKAMNDLIGKAGKGDSLVITFSGRGRPCFGLAFYWPAAKQQDPPRRRALPLGTLHRTPENR